MIYLHVPGADMIFLMDIYAKGEQEDLTSEQKKFLKTLADQYRRGITRIVKREPSS